LQEPNASFKKVTKASKRLNQGYLDGKQKREGEKRGYGDEMIIEKTDGIRHPRQKYVHQ